MLYNIMRSTLLFSIVFFFTFFSGCQGNPFGETTNNDSNISSPQPTLHPFLVDYITPPSPSSYYYFGARITSNGDYVLSVAKDTVFVYKQDENGSLTYLTNFLHNQWIDSIAIYNNYIAIGSTWVDNDPYDSEGAVTLYSIETNNSVTKLFTFNADDVADDWDEFGDDVELYQNYLLVKTTSDNAYLFKINDTNVTKITKFTLPSEYASSTYTYAKDIAIDNNQVVISASGDQDNVFIYNIEDNDTVSLMDTINFPYRISFFANNIAFKNGYLATTEQIFNVLHVYKISKEKITPLAERNINVVRRYDGSNYVSMDDNHILAFTANGDNFSISIYAIDGDNIIQKPDLVFPDTNIKDSNTPNAFCQNKDNLFLGFYAKNDMHGVAYHINLYAKDDVYVYTTPPQQLDIAEGATISYAFNAASPAGKLNYLISGDDQSYFQDNDNNLTNTVPFDYENPLDSNNDNNYTINLQLEDPLGNKKTFDFSIIVHDKQFIKKETISLPYTLAHDMDADGNYTIIGFWDDGTAYLYKNINGTTTKTAELLEKDTDIFFGDKVAIEGKYFAVSAMLANDTAGYVNVYKINNDESVTLIQQITLSGSNRFGSSLTINDNKLYVGAYSDSSLSQGDGKVVVYQINDTNVTQLFQYDTNNTNNSWTKYTKKIIVEDPYIISLGNGVHINKMDANGSYSEVATLENIYKDIGFENKHLVTIDDTNITIFEIDDNNTLHQLSSYKTDLSSTNSPYSLQLQDNKIYVCLNSDAKVFQIGSDNNITLYDQLNAYDNWSCKGMVKNAQDQIYIGGSVIDTSTPILMKYEKDQ